MLKPEQVETIRQMRLANASMDETARSAGCAEATARKYAKAMGLGGQRTAQTYVFKRNGWSEGRGFEAFLANMESNGHAEHFEYIEGYEGAESTVTLQCKACGIRLERGAQFARKRGVLVCAGCQQADQETHARERAIELRRRRLIRLLDKQIRAVQRFIFLFRECSECGQEFVATHGQQKLCSAECKRKRQNRVGERCKRARRHNAKKDRGITLKAVLQARGDVCYLCSERVDADDFVVNEQGHFIVGPNYPTVEHLVPLSKGGGDTWDNVMVAHHKCNTAKRDRLIVDKNGQMLLLM